MALSKQLGRCRIQPGDRRLPRKSQPIVRLIEPQFVIRRIRRHGPAVVTTVVAATCGSTTKLTPQNELQAERLICQTTLTTNTRNSLGVGLPKGDCRKGVTHGMAGTTLYQVSGNGCLSCRGHRVPDRAAEVSECRTWCCHRFPVGGDPHWKFFPCAGVRPSEIDLVSSLPLRNRLLGRSQFLSESQRRRMALGSARCICSCHWLFDGIYGCSLAET